MARPRAPELTERELEIMQVFWEQGEQTAAAVRDRLAEHGRDLAYTTIATLIRILTEKAFVEQTNLEWPFVYRPIRTFEEVSGNLLNDIVRRVFGGSREQLLVSLFGQQRLTKKEKESLRQLLKDQEK